jgi:7-cyano-7-deazaguanosine (preQ0) biosynthesis protein QueE
VATPDHLVVSEVFGPTFQGEGPSLGQRAAFVRLGRCNLACSWCDTPYTWRWEDHDPDVELRSVATGQVLADVMAMRTGLLVVTGGEPLLQQHALPGLLEGARALGMQVEVETAGTIIPAPDVDRLVNRWNVSPKLASSGNPVERRHKPEALRAFQATGRASFKFVVADAAELEEVAQIVDEHLLTDVWIMPEGTDAAAITDRMRALAAPVLERGWNLTTRLHVLVWGDQRGV